MNLPANLRPGAFAGTAAVYARYRPPYPRQLLDDLLERASIDRNVLLDLATGPGRIALDLAHAFDRVIAVDLEPEMIDVAKRLARERGIDNVDWRVGRAEDVDLGPESVDLVTIGEAFHRLEQSRVAAAAFRWLRPGGCLATLGSDDRFTGDEPWEATVREVRDRWLPQAFPDGWGRVLPGQGEGPEAREAVLRAGGFAHVQVRPFEQTLELTVDDILGHLASTSVCSRPALGESSEAFEHELRHALRADTSSRFTETILWSYSLARKPPG